MAEPGCSTDLSLTPCAQWTTQAVSILMDRQPGASSTEIGQRVGKVWPRRR
jgi:hypothetical protein